MSPETLVQDAAQALADWHRDPSHRGVRAVLVMAPASEDSPLMNVRHGDVRGIVLPLASEDFTAGCEALGRSVTEDLLP